MSAVKLVALSAAEEAIVSTTLPFMSLTASLSTARNVLAASVDRLSISLMAFRSDVESIRIG